MQIVSCMALSADKVFLHSIVTTFTYSFHHRPSRLVCTLFSPMQLSDLSSHSSHSSPPTHAARPCQLEHGTQLQCVCVCVCVCVFTHSCSSHSRAGIHNTRWSSVSAPLWTRCWCPRLSGRTWGPPWWPRPPPGTWAVWAEGWCPKAFWGSRRATCASRCKKREQEEGGWGVWGLAALEDKVRPPG